VVAVVGTVFILLAAADAVRRRRPTWGFLFLFLFLFSSLAVDGDGGGLGSAPLLRPAFAQHHLLEGHLPRS